jgi:hypothetical protein
VWYHFYPSDGCYTVWCSIWGLAIGLYYAAHVWVQPDTYHTRHLILAPKGCLVQLHGRGGETNCYSSSLFQNCWLLQVALTSCVNLLEEPVCRIGIKCLVKVAVHEHCCLRHHLCHDCCCLLLLLLLFVITFMWGTDSSVPAANHVSGVCNVATILHLKFNWFF